MRTRERRAQADVEAAYAHLRRTRRCGSGGRELHSGARKISGQSVERCLLGAAPRHEIRIERTVVILNYGDRLCGGDGCESERCDEARQGAKYAHQLTRQSLSTRGLQLIFFNSREFHNLNASPNKT